jgi:hypothetical protein
MKTLINIGEMPYPVFYIGTDSAGDVHVDVPAKTVSFWKKAAKDFTKAQQQMHEAVDKYEPTILNKN